MGYAPVLAAKYLSEEGQLFKCDECLGATKFSNGEAERLETGISVARKRNKGEYGVPFGEDRKPQPPNECARG